MMMNDGETATEPGGSAPNDNRKSATTPDKEHSMAPSSDKSFQTVMHDGVTTLTADIDDTALAIHCPADTQDGDMITCSVISDDPAKVNPNDYVVAIESTQVISEETEDKDKSKFSVNIPTGALAALISLKKKTGEEVCHGEMPVKPAMAMKPPAGEILFPRQVETGKPLLFKGDFAAPVKDTVVTVDGESANVLAKSPRTLVVDNKGLTEGAKNITVKSGETQISGPVNIFNPSTVARNLTPPQNLTQATTLAPDCQQQVNAYKAQLRSRVDQNWQPPKPPTHGTWVATLTYNLMKDLSVSNVQVVRSSGYSPLDQSAMSRVSRLNGQFGPIPECFTQPYLPIEHTFRVIYR
jgi:outer membrane biosynthesis protein TonB